MARSVKDRPDPLDHWVGHQRLSKVALPLWVQLRDSHPDQRFDVLLTLTREPDTKDLKQLEATGLEISAFHQSQPSRLMPGVITKCHLEGALLHCDLVRYVEGIPHQQDALV